MAPSWLLALLLCIASSLLSPAESFIPAPVMATPSTRHPQSLCMTMVGPWPSIMRAGMAAALACTVTLGGGSEVRAAMAERPIVDVIVQLPKGISLGRVIDNPSDSSLYVLGSTEAKGEPIIGAKVDLNSVQFPTKLRLFPVNMLGRKEWKGDLTKELLYVDVKICTTSGVDSDFGPFTCPPLLLVTDSHSSVVLLSHPCHTLACFPSTTAIDTLRCSYH
ncbi:unnamed protein product [Chrysoparadoxa australica]